MTHKFAIVAVVVVLCMCLCMTNMAQCKATKIAKKQDHRLIPDKDDPASKQLLLGAQSKETSTPDFVRLVVMRLIYGIAATIGLEDRLSNVFNGVFVPPNADEDYGYGLDDIFDE